MTDPFLARAARLAEKTMRRGAGGPFGCVIVRRGKTVGWGSNTVLKDRNATCHAEVNAIRMASRKLKSHLLKGCDVYSTTEPCPMCFSALHWAQVRRIIYSTTIADVKKLGFNELAISNVKLKRMGRSAVRLFRTRSPECRELLEKWRRLPRKMTY